MELINELIWDALKNKIIPNKVVMNMQQYRLLKNKIVNDKILSLTVEVKLKSNIYVE